MIKYLQLYATVGPMRETEMMCWEYFEELKPEPVI